MAILPGKRLGPYEILSAIGAGGMGEVYRARDTRLDRIVAIKVLPAHLADDPERRERFEREARTIARLNHPHICVLHDIGRQDGIDFLVMEYLEGETLAHRLLKGSLPLDQVLQYAIEIADALDKAHRKAVTHRDLKPGNIMLTKTGTKLLDFGLAKLRQDAAPAIPLSQLPTATAKEAVTQEGTILGTLQYMAPEQLEAKEVDARTDIFAFGAVVYEMAAGKRVFEGKSQASVIAAIMSSNPPSISSLQPMTPPQLERVVKKCLLKEPEKRWQDASDLCDELKWIAEGISHTSQPVATWAGRRKIRERLGWIVAAMAIAALLTVVTPAILNLHRPASDAQPIRFTIDPPEKGFFALGLASPWPAVSPDGRQIVYEATSADGQSSLWVRSLSSLSAQLLVSTPGSYSEVPFWSPDSRYVGFFSSDGKLKKVAVSGGPSETLCDAEGLRGGTWNQDGTIVFAQYAGLFRVSAAGGEAKALTRVERDKEYEHASPRFLPDGKHFLYVVLAPKPENAGIYVGSLDSAERVRLLDVVSQVEYSVGHLLFVRGDTLSAQPFDVDRLQVTGDVFPLAEGVSNNPTTARGAFGASPNGVLVYRGNDAGAGQLAWLDRTGKQLAMVAEQKITHFSLSADEKHAAVAVNGDLWVADLARGTSSRLTFGSLSGDSSVWSPDGSRVYFAGHEDGVHGLYQKASDGSRDEELVLKKDGVIPVDISRDGKFLLYEQTGPQTFSISDLWILPLSGDRQARPFAGDGFGAAEGQFSPDGRWVAYASSETETIQVYVQPSFGPSGKWQISTGGGEQPRWRGDGKEIFYVSGGRLMAVDIKTEPQFQAGQPRILFDGAVPPHDWRTGGNHYAVSADGKRFLILRPITGSLATRLTVLANWAAGLKK